jgi:hypothetical protein
VDDMDSTLKIIHNQLAEIVTLLRQQSNNLNANGTTELAFTVKYNLTLPCRTLGQLKALNEALTNDERCQEQFVSKHCVTNSNILYKQIGYV